MKSSTTEGIIHTAHTLSSICPNLFLPQEKWVPQAWKALQEQQAPQVLREREVTLVRVESLGLRGQQVSDGRSWGGASVFLCPPGAANAYPSTVPPPIRSELTLTGGRVSIYKEGTSMDSGSTVSRGVQSEEQGQSVQGRLVAGGWGWSVRRDGAWLGSGNRLHMGWVHC